MLKEANTEYSAWLAREIGHGVPLAYFKCPHCMANVATLMPEQGEIYSSFSSCPYCDQPFFKVVDNKSAPELRISAVPGVRR